MRPHKDAIRRGDAPVVATQGAAVGESPSCAPDEDTPRQTNCLTHLRQTRRQTDIARYVALGVAFTILFGPFIGRALCVI